MRKSPALISLLVIATAAAHVATGSAWIELFADVDPDRVSVVAFLYSPLSALSSVALPFLLGYLVGCRGFLLGASVGVLAGPGELLLITHNEPSLGIATQLLSSAVGAAILCSVAAAAGVLARGRGP